MQMSPDEPRELFCSSRQEALAGVRLIGSITKRRHAESLKRLLLERVLLLLFVGRRQDRATNLFVVFSHIDRRAQ